jgi:hypothetical protein
MASITIDYTPAILRHAGIGRYADELARALIARYPDQVIADSHCTKQDALRRYRLSPDRVRVVHLGVEARFNPIAAMSAPRLRERYRLPDRFILAVGTIEPRKNETYEAYREASAARPS